MGVAAVAVFPILIGLNIVYQKRVDTYYDAAQNHLGDLSAGVHESFDGVQLVKAYGAEQRETERLSEIAGRLRAARVDAVRLRGTFEALLDVVPSLTNVGLVAARCLPGAERRPHDRRAVQLRLPLHPARLPAATDRLRPLRAAALARRLEAGPRGARRADRARPAGGGRRPPIPVAGCSSSTSASRSPARDGRRSTTCRSTSAPGASSPSSVRPGPARPPSSRSSAGMVAPTGGHVAVAPGERAVVFQEAFLFSGTIRHNVVLGADDRRRTGVGGAAARPRRRLRRRDAARSRHRRRRAWRQPERWAAPAGRPRQGARAPTRPCCCSTTRRRRSTRRPRSAVLANLRGAFGEHHRADGRVTAVDDRPRRRGRLPRRRAGASTTARTTS